MLTDDDIAKLKEVFATKDDLGHMVDTLTDTFATKDDLREMETKLLTAFHDWADPYNSRIRALEANMRTAQIRLDKLERG